MVGRSARLLGALLLLILAGCSAPADRQEPQAPDNQSDFAFDTKGMVVRGLPALFEHEQGAGEPIIVAAPDGSLFLRYSGCSDGTPYEAMVLATFHFGIMEPPLCFHAPALVSRDGGASWTTVNDESGRLSQEAPHTVGGVLAVDSTGRLYSLETRCLSADLFVDDFATNLFGPCDQARGAILQTSSDGVSWEYVNDVFEGEADQWPRIPIVGAAEAGHAVVGWVTGYGSGSVLVVRTTFDGGRTFTGSRQLAKGLDNAGQIALDATGKTVYLPYSVQVSVDPAPLASELRLQVSEDGGLTWNERTTGVILQAAPGVYKCVTGYPSVAVASDGAVAFAYAAVDQASSAVRIHLVLSRDQGRTWSGPFDVSHEPTTIMPWLTAMPSGGFVLTQVANTMQGDPNVEGSWDVRAVRLSSDGSVLSDVLIDDVVHEGGLKLASDTTGSIDESLGAFFSNAIMPDGLVVVAYVADPKDGATSIQEIRFAIAREVPA